MVSKNLVGSIFRKGTALAYLYNVLKDGKPHDEKKIMADLRKRFTSTPVGALMRLRRFREKGTKLGIYTVALDTDKGTLIMRVYGKPVPVPEDKATSSEKDRKLIAALLRRTLKNGGVWTSKKLIEYFAERGYEIPPANTRAAIAFELANGGLQEIDGVLLLN